MQITIDQAIDRWGEFDSIIDVRSPAEFAHDHLPGAINSPVLNNEERAEVGTLYASSPFDAKKRGAALVARNIAIALETQFMNQPRNWRPLIYCWRGGNRSNAMATIMQRIGWRAHVLTGGYTAYRRHVVGDMARLAEQFQYAVVCGVTGSGKSLYLRQLAAQGYQVLDLEKLAHHRGSLLGNEPIGEQPSQKFFETLIWDQLRHFDPQQEVFVESESKKIGTVQVPDAVITKMRESRCIEITPTLADRVNFLCQDYAHFFEQPDVLVAQLTRLKPLVGGTRLNEWVEAIQAKDWSRLVESLLVHHYDPTYRRSMEKNYAQYGQAEMINQHPAATALI
ncbi:tRNA 2-selenouridine(34) synthase MnmH [beta proteobacterium MWH-UniP1]